LAREFDEYLRQSEASSLEPRQQEIRDYLRSGRMPTLFARNNLVRNPHQVRAGRARARSAERDERGRFSKRRAEQLSE
jgi:hypothetical protein